MNGVIDPVIDIVDVDGLAAGITGQIEAVANLMRHASECSMRLRTAKEEMETAEANAIAEGYAMGYIDGKNKEARDAQTAALLKRNTEYQAALARVRRAEQDYESANVEQEIANKRLGGYHSIAHIKGAQLMYAAANARAGEF